MTIRWHRLAIVTMIAVFVAVMVDPLFSILAALGVIAIGVILEMALFLEA